MGTLLHMMFKIIFILTLILGSAFSQRSQRDFERELKAQNSAIQSLKDEIETIKDDDEYVEHIARENFGLIMDGEEYIIEDPE